MRFRSVPRLSPASTAFLDVVRAVAANLVLVEHASRIYVGPPRYPIAMVGVTLFFLISGFLIFVSAWRRFDRPEPGFAPFLLDRVCRIYTAFIPALLIAALLAHLFVVGDWGQPGLNRGPLALIGNALLLNDYPAFQVISRVTGHFDLHLRSYDTAEQFWTIPIEFWIYVVFGFVAFCAVRGERLRGFAMPALILVGIPVVVWNSFAGGGEGLSVLWCLGALFGLVFIQAGAGGRRTLVGGLVIAAWGALALAGRVSQHGFPGYEVQTELFIAMIVFGLLLALNTVTAPVRIVSGLAGAFASYSYSLYLIHNTILIVFAENLRPVFGTYTMIAAMGAAHVAAIALYWWFERHHKVVAGWLKIRLLHRGGRLAGGPEASGTRLEPASRGIVPVA